MRRPRRDDDSGSSLIMAMMFTTGVGLVVMALLTYGLAAVQSEAVTARVAQRSADVAGALQTAINDVRNSLYNNSENQASGLPCLGAGNRRVYAPLVNDAGEPSQLPSSGIAGLPTTVTCTPDPTSGDSGGASVPINAANRPPAAALTLGTYSSGAAAGTPPAAPGGLVVSPAIGPAGTPIVANGANMAGTTAVQIGTTAELASATGMTMSPCVGAIVEPGCFVATGNVVRFLAPVHAQGVVQVKIITLGAAAAATYTYMAAPVAPSTPSATAGVASATVAWTAPADGGSPITGYAITPRRDGNVQPTIQVGPTPTSTTITGLTVGSSYTFTVAAVNAGGTGVPSAASAPVVPYALPAAPAQPAATAGPARAGLTWIAPADGSSAITGYVITPYKAGVVQTAVLVGPSPAATVTGLTVGTSYTFTVAAVNAAGTGPASAQSNAVSPYGTPAAPAKPTATAGITSATVTWDAPVDGGSTITGYLVTSYKDGVAEPPVSVGAAVRSRTYPSLTVGASYTFTVAAENAGGPGPTSVQSNAVVPYTLPGAPAQPTASAGPASATVSWVAPATGGSALTGYIVTSYKNGVAEAPVAVGAGVTSRTYPSLTVGGSYTFTVAAQNAGGTGPASVQSAAVVPFTPAAAPGAPGQPVATAGPASVALVWSVPGDGGSPLTGYVITPVMNGVIQPTVTVGPSPASATISNLTVGASYTFTVVAVNAVGTGPASPASVAVIPYALPGAPAQPTATAGVSSATVSWTAPGTGGSAITGYVVTSYRNGTAETPIYVGAAVTSRTYPALTVGVPYTFTVAAQNAGGTGPASVQSNAVVPYALPGAPAQPTATAGISSATISWTAPTANGSAITGYVVTPHRAGIAQTATTVGATPTSTMLNGLVAGVQYTFTVAAINAAGTGPASPQSAAVEPYAAPGAPAQPTATAGISSATVTWVAPAPNGSPITGYVITPYLGATAQPPLTVGATPTSRTITGLTAGSSYTFTVAARNAAGTGPASVASNAVVPYALPGTPAQPGATAGITSATVTWAAPAANGSPITGYVITPYIGAAAQPPTTVGATPTSRTITGLTAGTSYTFTVAATNAAGTGAASPASAAVVPYARPGTPAQPTATAGPASATVSWVAPAANGSPITGYVITPFIGATAQPQVTVGATPTSRTITGLTVGASYTFTVAATNAAGTGTASTPSVAVVPYAVAPGAPPTPTATAGAAAATVTWSAPTNNGGSAITGYVITPWRAGVAQTPRDVAATPTSATFSGLTVGVSYTFTVAAKNAVGTGPASAQSNAVVPFTVPGTPARPSATSGQASATVTWTAPASNGGSPITGYRITPIANGVPETPVTVGASPTSAVVDNLRVNIGYNFTVAALNAAGASAPSEASYTVVPYAVVPGAPTIGAAAPGTGGASVSWTAPADDGDSPITGYVVIPYELVNGVWTARPGSDYQSTATTQRVINLTPGTTYRFTVSAKNNVGTGAASAPSNSVVVNLYPWVTFPTTLPNGRVNTFYSYTLTRQGGTAPFVWSIIGGGLPPGLTLGSSNGVISGTPTSTGTYWFTAKITDSYNATASNHASITVNWTAAATAWTTGGAPSAGVAPASLTDPALLYAALRESRTRLVARPPVGTGRGARRFRRRGARRSMWLRCTAVAGAAAVFTAALVAMPAAVALADGTQLFEQDFRNNTADGVGAVALPGLPEGGENSACLTASGNPGPSSLRSCATALDDPGDGTLRLTDDTGYKTGGLFAASSMPISLGLDVRFDMYQYGGTSADGIAMVVAAVDPAVPVSPANIGQTGGALGYSADLPGSKRGLSHGYLGFGFDVYGNFSNTVYQGSGCANPPYVGNGRSVPGQVVVRGPGHGLVGYCAINSTASAASPTPAAVPIRAATRAASRVPAEVLINPSTSPLTSASGIVAQPNTYTLVFTPVGQAARTLTGVLPTVPPGLYPKRWLNAAGYPKQLAFGWVGSTGASTDFHEVDLTSVSTLSPARAPALVVGQTAYSASALAPGDPVSYTVTAGVQPGTVEPAPITVTETLPEGVVPVAAFGTEWDCDPPVGRTISCVNTGVPFEAGSTLPPLTITAIVTAAGITPAFVQRNSIVSASSRDAETVYGGETGWRNAGSAPLRISGDVYSNSTIVSAGTVGACTGTWPLLAGTSDCNGMYVNGSVTGERSCVGQIVTAPEFATTCPASHTTLGNDPGIGSPASYGQPVAGMTAQALPTCSSGAVVAFTPGYYDDAVGLSALTSGATGCRNKTFWFQPGNYYFDFHNSEMPTGGGPVVPNGSDVWTLNDASSVVVGGQQAVQGQPASWPAGGLTAADLPGACVSPLRSTTSVGVQFVFGDDSRFVQQAGSVELCGTYSASKPPIVMSGATGAGGSAASAALLRPSSLGAVDSVPATAPAYSPLTSATPLATANDANAGPTVTALPQSSTATLRVAALSGAVAAPARSVLDAATVTVTHGEANAAAGTTMKLVVTPSRAGASPITREIPISRTSTLTYATQVVDISDELRSEVYGFGSSSFTVELVLTTSAAAQSVTSSVDFLKVDLAWKTVAVRAQSGCATMVNGCSVLESTSAGALLNELYLQGTVYLPAARIDVAMHATDGAVFPHGVIARALVVDSDAYAGSDVYDGVLIRVPAIGTGPSPLKVYLTAWTCKTPGACPDPGPSTAGGWTSAGRALVRYTDAVPTQPVAGQRNVYVDSWQLTR